MASAGGSWGTVKSGVNRGQSFFRSAGESRQKAVRRKFG